ncbi:hypothetical protein BV20DRAFT_723231 [Pilatotrama ljubarskyi]|nr:hypothetical protein BV20DRAFT_723231 [Pilatotrama ljubarskyi]
MDGLRTMYTAGHFACNSGGAPQCHGRLGRSARTRMAHVARRILDSQHAKRADVLEGQRRLVQSGYASATNALERSSVLVVFAACSMAITACQAMSAGKSCADFSPY